MPQKEQGLYHPSFEHDSCGVGFVVDIHGNRTHQTVEEGITVLQNLVHRGALGADKKSGDGAGILTQLPHQFFQKVTPQLDITLPDEGEYGVAMVFLPLDDERQSQTISAIERAIESEKALLLGWRDVPTMDEDLGYIAKESIPIIKQFFVSFTSTPKELIEKKLFILRKVIEKSIYSEEITIDDFYISSLSSKTIIYKGMLVGRQVQQFYPDLTDESYTTAIALVHQRYSTNTFPSWALAQPFRYIAHNGEINTIRGNKNKMKARESSLSSTYFGNDLQKLFPIVTENSSDSGTFDSVFELLTQSGRSMEHTTMMMVPEAFGKEYHISEDKRSFYQFHASIMEPWDGPAAIAYTDGTKIGAVLDRNGLRPARYMITKSGKMVLASETGVLDFPPEDIIRKGRLKPGSMVLIDTTIGRVAHNNEIKSNISRQSKYRHWLEKHQIELKGLFETPEPVKVERHSLKTRQKIFGYTFEDIEKIMKPMAINGQEPLSSMGNDAPLAILSDKPQLLYNYFKQLFAQVTNPPIDPYRENMVMSLMSFIGRERNLLEEIPKSCHQLKLPHPILSNGDIKKLKHLKERDFSTCVLHSCFDNNLSLEEALETLCLSAEEAVDRGHSLIVLSDRNLEENEIPIPALLATSAVHHHLVRKAKRHLSGLVIETGEAREVTHFATLVAYGASAVNPYLAFETLANLHQENALSDDLSNTDIIDNYITAIKKGLLKIMSKMGVSTIRSYKGAQIFEIVGLNRAFVDKYFTGTASRIEGLGLDDIEQEYRNRYDTLMAEKDGVEKENIESGGDIHYRTNSEKHLITPESIALLQKAVRTGDYALFKKYTKEINDNDKNHCTIRGLLSFQERESIPLDEVEPVENIVKRFVTSAMSFGSLSKEAHETLAIAMNRLDAMSNSGEGGEQEERYTPLENGDSRNSSVKQIASARFGVNSHYLVNSKELQIKIAQGAKPGEGGQLPAHKANETIAAVRHGTPGIMYISPPPHHDIYSIEDLSQLIYDLKNGNPDARISVKLVAEAGVGSVGEGGAKGKADIILIGGLDGGTGASNFTCI